MTEKEANKQNTTENATIVNSSGAFPFLELGHTRKYRKELSLAIQGRLRMLGAFGHRLKYFTEADELKF